jgi:hypothetical protein
MAAAAAPTAAAPETTGTVPNGPSAPAEAKTLPNWILHGVRGRHALVENSHGEDPDNISARPTKQNRAFGRLTRDRDSHSRRDKKVDS